MILFLTHIKPQNGTLRITLSPVVYKLHPVSI